MVGAILRYGCQRNCWQYLSKFAVLWVVYKATECLIEHDLDNLQSTISSFSASYYQNDDLHCDLTALSLARYSNIIIPIITEYQ